MDEALDLLSDSLGQREPDPDENKTVVDKVKVTKDILKLVQSGGETKVNNWKKNPNKRKKPKQTKSEILTLLVGCFGVFYIFF